MGRTVSILISGPPFSTRMRANDGRFIQMFNGAYTGAENPMVGTTIQYKTQVYGVKLGLYIINSTSATSQTTVFFRLEEGGKNSQKNIATKTFVRTEINNITQSNI